MQTLQRGGRFTKGQQLLTCSLAYVMSLVVPTNTYLDLMPWDVERLMDMQNTLMMSCSSWRSGSLRQFFLKHHACSSKQQLSRTWTSRSYVVTFRSIPETVWASKLLTSSFIYAQLLLGPISNKSMHNIFVFLCVHVGITLLVLRRMVAFFLQHLWETIILPFWPSRWAAGSWELLASSARSHGTWQGRQSIWKSGLIPYWHYCVLFFFVLS